jgi:hypothetical protein
VAALMGTRGTSSNCAATTTAMCGSDPSTWET